MKRVNFNNSLVVSVFIIWQIAIAQSTHIDKIEEYSAKVLSIYKGDSKETILGQNLVKWQFRVGSDYSTNFKQGKKYLTLKKNQTGKYVPIRQGKVKAIEIGKEGVIFETNYLNNKPEMDLRVVTDKHIIYELNTWGTGMGYVLPFGIGFDLMLLSFKIPTIDGAFIEVSLGNIQVNGGSSYDTKHYKGPIESRILAGNQLSARYYPLLSRNYPLSTSLGIGNGFSGISVLQEDGGGYDNYEESGLYYSLGIGYDIPLATGTFMLMFEAKLVDSFQKGFRPMIVFPSITFRGWISALFATSWN